MNIQKYSSYVSRVDMNRIEKCPETFMIGRLASYIDMTVDKYSQIQFFVEPLCDEPKTIVEMDNFDALNLRYIGFDHQQYDDIIPPYYDKYSSDIPERIRMLEEHFSNKFIIYRPNYYWNSGQRSWYKNLTIDRLIDADGSMDTYFVSVPTVSMTPFEFEMKLTKNEYFDLQECDSDVMDAPEMILCDHYVYKVNIDISDPVFENSRNSTTRWRCIDSNNIIKLDIQDDLDHGLNVIRASEYTSFINADIYSSYMLKETSLQFEDMKRPHEDVDEWEMGIDIEEMYEDNLQIIEDEIKFLDGLKELTIGGGLQYRYDDLVNFHTSIKTNPLTILAGMSGTGKSQLALNYAKMLDLSEDNNTLLFMPISPAYQEPADVLGYYNALNNSYVPSETGFVQFLQHAMSNPDQMHMVIFDEMNLSQIEYWFSPFISILEKDLDERILKLYDEELLCENGELYPSTIKITENIIFIGTVNIDDTTKDFSDRLLDRTFVINLQQISFEEFFKNYKDSVKNATRNDLTSVKCKSVNQFVSWKRGDDRKYIEVFNGHNDELQLFDEMNSLIKHYIPYGGISFRVIKNIGNYLLNIPVKENNELVISRSDAIDFIVKQTILTKVRGTETQLENLLGFEDENGKLIHSELLDLLERYSSVSNFTKTKEEMMIKVEALRIHGYTN